MRKTLSWISFISLLVMLATSFTANAVPMEGSYYVDSTYTHKTPNINNFIILINTADNKVVNFSVYQFRRLSPASKGDAITYSLGTQSLNKTNIAYARIKLSGTQT